MNNLLRTLTESQARSSVAGADLKLLLTTVKDGRRQSYDAKLSDPFYDSLEGLLVDLRTVTMDNHDAEAFLKPVSKTDVPDYYDVISNPMDLSTMMRKVKSKHYKSKREFKDDLDLIWSNCFTYNATENHPLRLCARRLKYKAEKLLKNITDRRERTDPFIPSDLSSSRNGITRKVNGVSINGHTRTRSPSVPSKHSTPIKPSSPSTPITSRRRRRDIPFADSPAIIRTPSGMADFLHLDRELSLLSSAAHSHDSELLIEERLKELAAHIEYESDSDESSPGNDIKIVEGQVGEKRKLNGITDRPRKRAKYQARTLEDKDPIDYWWSAVSSDVLLANGFPELVHASSHPVRIPTTLAVKRSPKKRRRGKKAAPPPNSMLHIMNQNIKTMKRVRRTHAKFSALNINSEEGGPVEEPPELSGEEVEEVVDERPWKVKGSGVDIGEKSATDCLHWMGGKVLEHAGFQGSSKVALDVLTGVASEYLLNVGRTTRFLCDKYANKMTAEEIILHTLFESGVTRIQDLERYIKDDVIRYGARLGEVEKKLVSAYREVTAVEALDDDDLFGNEDEEEEEGAFVMGNFADAFGEDFLGLRELGIAAEFGMSSLSIPKRLLKGKRKGGHELSSSVAKPTEPPPPYPRPPPFSPLTSEKIDDQIGLLRPYYHGRLSELAASVPPPPPLYPVAYGIAPTTYPADIKAANPTLPDDAPNPSHVKIGPLGQVIRGSSSGTTTKKKAKGKEPLYRMPEKSEEIGMASELPAAGSSADVPKKKKGPAPGSTRKKGKGVEGLPPVIAASA